MRSGWKATIAVVAVVASGLAAFASGCIRMPTINATNAPAIKKASDPTYGPFKLKPDFDGACARVDVVDVDLGHTSESFVRAAHC